MNTVNPNSATHLIASEKGVVCKSNNQMRIRFKNGEILFESNGRIISHKSPWWGSLNGSVRKAGRLIDFLSANISNDKTSKATLEEFQKKEAEFFRNAASV